jgi:hypothetical protein
MNPEPVQATTAKKDFRKAMGTTCLIPQTRNINNTNKSQGDKK